MIGWHATEWQSTDGRFRVTITQGEYCLLVRNDVWGVSASLSWHPTLQEAFERADAIEKRATTEAV